MRDKELQQLAEKYYDNGFRRNHDPQLREQMVTFAVDFHSAYCNLLAIRRNVMLEAARLVCGYCADPERWDAPKRGSYPEWWHQLSKPPNTVRNKCSAWAIYEHMDFERRKAGEKHLLEKEGGK